MGTYILRRGSATLADLSDGPRAGSWLAHTNGRDFYLDPANGNDANSGTSKDAAFATLAVAYAACTANQHDVVWYIAGSSGTNLSAAVTWAKNYTHLIGLCAPTHVSQRARFFQLSTLTGASPLLTISATGCMFKDFYIFQGVDDATSLLNVSVTGGRNYFENVHFAGGGHATQAVNGGASLFLNGAEENLFVNCTIGVDTIDAATGMVGILVDAESTRNEFRSCKVTMKAGNAGAAFLEIVDATSLDRYMIFKNCLFLNTSGTAMTAGFVIPAGFSPPRGPIILKDCLSYGATIWDAGSRGQVMGDMSAVTGAALSGVAVELIT